MKEFFQELLEKAKDIKSVDDIFAFAQEKGINITEEQAKEYFEQIKDKVDLSKLGKLGSLFKKD
ncbi:MAG: hypothetical protein IJC20_03740 [Clostridia bacterium]|nr:hypothetical protein [Clostridia bacterium]